MDNPKILLVDDEVEFVTTLAERLGLRGFDARIATDGEGALQMFEAEAPHLVVLDLMMPGIGGLEVLKQIKGMNPGMPVILLTGQGSTAEGIEGMRLGAFDYLMKPINIDELIQVIKKAIGSE